MNRYALLILPASNRVYAEASPELTQAELELFGHRVLSAEPVKVEPERIGGVPYVTWEAAELTARDLAYLSNLSAVYALFALAEGPAGTSQDTRLLRPLPLSPLDVFDDDLITIQKYAGKTNEYFTKLLLNVTLLASDFADRMLDRRLHVFDPLCGRGTTLNQALMYGYNATGMDIDGKDFDAYSGFIRSWLKRKRIKHRSETTPVRRNHKVLGRRLQIGIGLPGSDAPVKQGASELTVVNADTLQGREIFRREAFDLLVTDLPYGVQHGSRSPGAALSRRPLDLLRAALPVWVELLRRGGAVGLAWNTHVASRDDAEAELRRAGLEVCDSPAYLGFRHRVDNAIVRDILVAKKV